MEEARQKLKFSARAHILSKVNNIFLKFLIFQSAKHFQLNLFKSFIRAWFTIIYSEYRGANNNWLEDLQPWISANVFLCVATQYSVFL